MPTATIICGSCDRIRPLLGSCGGGPNRSKRICLDCRGQYAPEVKPSAFMYRQRGLSFRRIAERLMEQYTPSPSAWIIEQWCRDAGVTKNNQPTQQESP